MAREPGRSPGGLVLHEMRWSHVVVALAPLIVGILIGPAVDGGIDARRDAIRIELSTRHGP